MNYLIANTVIYDTENGVIQMQDAQHQDEAKTLTPTANRILALLLSAPGEVFKREDILDKVWESQGHAGSNSSLNQYISILRKTLSAWIDDDDIIISVPRVGFYFNSAISVVPWVQAADEQPDGATNETQPGVTPSHPSERLPLIPLVVNLVLIAAILLVSTLAVKNYREVHVSPLYSKVYPQGKLGLCQLNAWQKLSPEMRKNTLEILNIAAPELKEKCLSEPAVVYFQIQNQVYLGRAGRIFIATCSQEKGLNNLLYCDSTYKYNWRRK
ncbi:hypothetical protein A9B99_11915 [Mangrovibacter phragmitis]|uniref:OmpR/PhoB-type domain-containing protein n=2 Tax=Mangrovibacter phragmitis TaxID=1691903 RepID=A0A1B7L1A0_9ENTR|nr:hypothetical protein A9B99_11915 [Mangrovibacter phragmitis]